MERNTEKCKNEIEKWLKEEKIPNARTDDHIILRYLEGCKYRVDKAKLKMKNFFELRRNTPDWFEGRDPMNNHVKHLLELGVLVQLPTKDDEGRSFVVVRATINNPRTHSMTEVFKVGMMVVDLMLELDETIVRNGLHVIIDLKDVSFNHALQMTPSLIRQAVYSWQNCYPISIKGIDFVNCPPHVNIVLKIFKQFMAEKLRRRVRVHGANLEKLKEIIGAKYLPIDYGGKCSELSEVAAAWKEKVDERRQWFLDDVTVKQTYNVDEVKLSF